ncbi:MAG: M12 family metallo-peptidase [Planctomycetia bacterium]|nr:M12 family metallo-peptidase [Planctomycetia bacterium]
MLEDCRRILFLVLGGMLLWGLPVEAQRVSVVANQASANVSFWLLYPDGTREAQKLRVGESLAVPNPDGAEVAFRFGSKVARQPLRQDGIHAFSDPTGKLELFYLGPEFPPEFQMKPFPSPWKREDYYLTIPVKIYADENIPLVFDIWKRKVEARFAEVSKVLEKTCFVRLEIVSFSVWRSNPESPDLHTLLQDFERQVPLTPKTLSIGFTSHRNFVKAGVTELGVARTPFYPRILLREEAPQITDIERLETLLHELGHFFGAVHTTDDNSIMRMVLKERLGRKAEFCISFDPINTLVMNFWIREYRRQEMRQIATLRNDSRLEIIGAYRMICEFADRQREQGGNVPENPNVDVLLKILEGASVPQEMLVSAPRSVPVRPSAPEESKDMDSDEESGVDPEDPLGIRSEEASPPERNEESVPEPKPASPVGANPEDPLGIMRDSSEESRDLEDISEEPVPEKPTVKKTPETPLEQLEAIRETLMADGWKTEKVTPYTLPSRTTQYVLVSTLISVLSDDWLNRGVTSGKITPDAYGERMVRYAAAAALEVGGDAPASEPRGRVARQAFVLALEVLFEPSGTLQNLPVYGKRFRALETAEIRKIRREHVQNVTIFGRSDLCQHFWVSAALAVHLDPSAVEIIGLEKERKDAAPGGSGFDVTDLNADLAGVGFARSVMDGTIPLEKVIRKFRFEEIVPSKIRLPKALKHPETREEEDETLNRLREAVQEHQAQF